ncbi:uncharacterized protein LOC124329197 [Daphnia pulicaria]|uniref:uncharacterized protein LOC124329197 n=1 Tax=Daphnia pulicaria TaxID=35523 RepID=UPI001EEB8008|nr:uncharacterized protein LOC124329197 [Daphnia pulicaria]
MDWKVFVLVAILPSALSLPMELCCQSSSSSSIASSSLNVKLDSSIPVSDSEMLEPFISPSISSSSKTPDPLLMLMPQQHQESPSCCGNDNDLPTEKKQVKRTRMKIRGTTSSGLRRTKRFPIHLDPLYQYRYLARSGQCPTAKDGQPEFYCPTPDRNGNWRCIDDFQLCDGVRHCPNGEDELPVSCLFYRVVETHLLSVSQRLNSDENRQRGVPR